MTPTTSTTHETNAVLISSSVTNLSERSWLTRDSLEYLFEFLLERSITSCFVWSDDYFILPSWRAGAHWDTSLTPTRRQGPSSAEMKLRFPSFHIYQELQQRDKRRFLIRSSWKVKTVCTLVEIPRSVLISRWVLEFHCSPVPVLMGCQGFLFSANDY